MAAFINKQTKIRLLCERAEKEDLQREELASRGLSRQEIETAVQQSRIEKYRNNSVNIPWMESEKVVPTLSSTNIGLPNTHLVKTSTQALNAPVQKKYDKYRLQTQTIKLDPIEGASNQKPRAQTSNFEELRKTNKKLAQKEQDRQIKQQNFRDHLSEMYKGMDSLNKGPLVSYTHEQFTFDKNMQNLCDNVNFDHHLLKNDIKWYSEAYVKYKGTMRK